MFTDSYQVEEQSLSTGKWVKLASFRLKYRWRYVTHRLLGLIKWVRPEITGPKLIQAVIVKVRAYNYARKILRVRRPRSIRITRIDREGARLVKVVIWLNGEWNE